MNWLIFALFAYGMLVLERGLWMLLSIPSPPAGVSPSFMLVLAVYIGVMAPGHVVPWALLILGVLVDLQPGPLQDGVILGPAALGYLAGAFAVLQLRALVFRESVISVAILVFTVGLFVQLTIVAIYTARGLPWPLAEPIPGWSAADQLVHRFLGLLYSALIAIPLAPLLLKSTPIWGFPPRGRGDRHY